MWLWTRGPTLDADQCINVVRYRCCRLRPAVELLLALSLLPFVDRRGLSHPFHSLNLAAAITFTPMRCRWDIASSRLTWRHDALLDRACVCAILRSICGFWKSDLPSRYTCGLGHFAMACKCSNGLKKRTILYEQAPTKISILASSRFCLTNVAILNAPRHFQSDQFQHNHEWCAGRHPLQVHGLYSSAQVALETQKMQYINPPSCPTQRGVVKHKCGENTWGSYFVLFDL